MKMDMTKPCSTCPFRTDITPFIKPERAEEILNSLIVKDESFPCHKTTVHDDDGEKISSPVNESHCAGALILLEKIEEPNQWMRSAERLRIYDRHKLDMSAPIYNSEEEMLKRHFCYLGRNEGL